jgi:septum formation protein
MLHDAGVPFDAVDAGCDEEGEKIRMREQSLDACRLAAALAEVKAAAVQARTGELVLGADQTLECDDGSMLDKASSRAEALVQLRRLSGQTHRLHSAAVILEDGKIVWRETESARLDMRPLSETFLQDYLDAEYESVRYNVGCYRIEGQGVQLFDRIHGSHFAIMGLPLLSLLAYLRKRGIMSH